MNVKLSDEQRHALEASADHPLPVADDLNAKVYYLLDEESYLHLQGLQVEHERRCHEQLAQLIDEGVRSPGVPADEAFARLRALAATLTRSVP
jgi:hypothetical protein